MSFVDYLHLPPLLLLHFFNKVIAILYKHKSILKSNNKSIVHAMFIIHEKNPEKRNAFVNVNEHFKLFHFLNSTRKSY